MKTYAVLYYKDKPYKIFEDFYDCLIYQSMFISNEQQIHWNVKIKSKQMALLIKTWYKIETMKSTYLNT